MHPIAPLTGFPGNLFSMLSFLLLWSPVMSWACVMHAPPYPPHNSKIPLLKTGYITGLVGVVVMTSQNLATHNMSGHVKNVLPNILFFFFCALYSSCLKVSKNAIKNEECQCYFLWVIFWYALHTKFSKKLMTHLANIKTCWQHASNISN